LFWVWASASCSLMTSALFILIVFIYYLIFKQRITCLTFHPLIQAKALLVNLLSRLRAILCLFLVIYPRKTDWIFSAHILTN
jgi:hypothetical protein